MEYDIIVIGGGPAGISAAIEAKKSNGTSVLIIERAVELGGILNQCIHNGFGLRIFKEDLTGPEYAQKLINEVHALNIDYLVNTSVIDIKNKIVKYVNSSGYVSISAKAIILAMGCREKTRGALAIPGFRPAGIFTAGTAQRYINIEGYRVGRKIVILGSGDIGLIMARRLTLEGAEVLLVAEIQSYASGLSRNVVQCLDDFEIPLLLNHTVVDIKGKNRLEGVVLAEVDEDFKPIPGSEKAYACDTLLLSTGLIPENELSKGAGVLLDKRTSGPIIDSHYETNIKGIFACGNVLHVHDLVDAVTEEARRAGRKAAEYVKEKKPVTQSIETLARAGIAYVLPQFIYKDTLKTIQLFFRVDQVHFNVSLHISSGDKVIKDMEKKYLLPGAMESISLTPDDLKDIGDKIEIRLIKHV